VSARPLGGGVRPQGGGAGAARALHQCP
jgi:hypothetical protein